jgi:hypothetical protein
MSVSRAELPAHSTRPRCHRSRAGELRLWDPHAWSTLGPSMACCRYEAERWADPRSFQRRTVMEADAADEARHGGVDTGIRPVAVMLAPLFRTLLGDPVPLPVRFWDESRIGEPTGPATIVLRCPAALQRIVRAPGELGFARAYVSGDLDVEGDLIDALRVLSGVNPHLRMGPRAGLFFRRRSRHRPQLLPSPDLST